MAIVQYTKELTERLIQEFNELQDVDQVAAKLDIPRRSVIAKLSSLGLYKRKEYTDKRGNLPIKKEFYVEKIAEIIDLDIDLADSLAKVNKPILQKLYEALSE